MRPEKAIFKFVLVDVVFKCIFFFNLCFLTQYGFRNMSTHVFVKSSKFSVVLQLKRIELFNSVYTQSAVKVQPLMVICNSRCPGSSDPFYIVIYYIKWVTTSWT